MSPFTLNPYISSSLVKTPNTCNPFRESSTVYRLGICIFVSHVQLPLDCNAGWKKDGLWAFLNNCHHFQEMWRASAVDQNVLQPFSPLPPFFSMIALSFASYLSPWDQFIIGEDPHHLQPFPSSLLCTLWLAICILMYHQCTVAILVSVFEREMEFGIYFCCQH